MPLLVAVKVYNLPVAARVRPAHTSWLLVVAVEFLTIDEVHAADRTAVILSLDQFHVTVAQMSDVGPLP